VSDAPRPLPRAVMAPALAAVLFLALPLVGLAAGAPWSTLAREATRPEVLEALWLSVRCSASAAALAFALGLPLALWLASGRSPARTAARILVALPMVLPPVVAGLALLRAYGRSGIAGGLLEAVLGAALPFTTAGVVVAETYVALPFFVLAAEAALRGVDPRLADAARTLGASPWRVLATVTVPLAAPGIAAGVLVAWARAIGEFGATITFAGSFAGETRTMPLAVYSALESSAEGAVVLSLLLVAVSAAVLFALRRRWFPSR